MCGGIQPAAGHCRTLLVHCVQFDPLALAGPYGHVKSNE